MISASCTKPTFSYKCIAGAQRALVSRYSVSAPNSAARAIIARNRNSPALRPRASGRTPILVNSKRRSPVFCNAHAPTTPSPSAATKRISPPGAMMRARGCSSTSRSVGSSVNIVSIHCALMSWNAGARSSENGSTVSIGARRSSDASSSPRSSLASRASNGRAPSPHTSATAASTRGQTVAADCASTACACSLSKSRDAAGHRRLAEAQRLGHRTDGHRPFAVQRREQRIMAGLERQPGLFDHAGDVRLHPFAQSPHAAA
ncbi:hypothetical protein WR25_24161 [Diploscapter pachys]|uniref:Uncharacterized protein n=1 Tax=Diploscapter pachys TaxID=2018661 RepID=A0A2A2KJC4_9BILA|nr:hypothetical protein WR25_24161 [Diploscapter pachys]